MDTEKEKEQKKSETQDEILLAALKLFTDKGYFNTSLTDIKDEAGIKATSTIYQHFKNKQAIAEELYQYILNSFSCSIDDIRRTSKKPSDQLREIVNLMFGLAEEAPDIMYFLLKMNHAEFLTDVKPVMETAPYEKIIKIIQSGIKAKEIRSIEPLKAYTYFFGVINHTLEMVLTGSLDKSADAYLSEAWVTAWNTIAKKM